MLFGSFSWALLSSLVTKTVANGSGGCWTNNCTDPIELVPAPWTLHGTGWAIPLPAALSLPEKTDSPLERQQGSKATAGLYTGIVGAIQMIRYTDTPVGPYDEFVLIPGAFTYSGPYLGLPQTDLRVSRMYVSQKYTCYNGRANWNIPKHLASFNWTDNADGSTTLKLYPHDTTGDESEASPADKPFFQAIIYPDVSPDLSVNFSSPLIPEGVPVRLNQAPLPSGSGSYGELPGTETWGNTVLALQDTTPGVAMVDLDQGAGDAVAGEDVNAVGDEFYQNFWPTLGRWNAAVKLEDFTIIFNPAETWG
ncbi:uncharacterized protein JN550_004375 [Neoarthrinium moseri]|uniref:uncharacterized protein n=1 Tax=Neoarthrinium moseri TaxID=1658444 RepID=UPI001FDD7E30|nr:uncharacterized protein JN550_004375 [Neoarthrinium moseri]KAI1871381.1 hypothetical protein JN550_004375 [Neoarthrinium moseri]